MRVEFHPRADAEFAAGIVYYNRKGDGLGNRFYREVMAQIEWIAANLEIPRVRAGYRRVNLRSFPFYIAYQTKGDVIHVYAIGNAHRKPEYWSKRLGGA